MLLSGLLTSEGWLGFGVTYALYLKEIYLKYAFFINSARNTPACGRLKGIKERGN